MKTPVVVLPARILAVAMASAPLLSISVSAVEAPPTVLTCEEVGAFYGRWLVAGEPLTRLVVKGTVTGLAAKGDRGYTYICDVPDQRVVCVEQSIAGLSIGDVVTLEGVVSSGLDTELWLDPCGSILKK